MFLIHNDKTQVPHGHKQSRAGADRDLNFAFLYSPPLVIANTPGNATVYQRYFLVSESRPDPGNYLGGKADFRNKKNHPPSLFSRLFHCLKIDFRFAAPCYAMEKIG